MRHADELCRFLDAHEIAYQRCDHPAVFTCAEADALVPALPGAKCKNLFLCDDKGRSHFLVVVAAAKRVDLRALAQVLAAKKLRFASPRRLERRLGLTPGAVTLLAVVNDPDQEVSVVVDAVLWAGDALLCHPLVNTSTLSLSMGAIRRFLAVTGHRARVAEIPTKKDPV